MAGGYPFRAVDLTGRDLSYDAAVVRGGVADGSPDDGQPGVPVAGRVTNNRSGSFLNGSVTRWAMDTKGSGYVVISGPDSTAAAAVGTAADNESAAGNKLATRALLHIQNTGGTRDIVRDVAASKNSSGLGVIATAPPLLASNDLTPVAFSNVAAAGDTTLSIATASVSSRVHSLRLTALATAKVTIKTGSTVREVINLVAGIPFNLPFRARPYYKTGINEALILNVSSAVQVDGVVELYTA